MKREKETSVTLGEDTEPLSPPPLHKRPPRGLAAIGWPVIAAVLAGLLIGLHGMADPEPAPDSGAIEFNEVLEAETWEEALTTAPPEAREPWTRYMPVSMLFAIAALLGLSAFFSGSETAFFSIHKIRLRAMAEDERYTARLVARMLEQPGHLLTTILVGNILINVLIGVLLGSRVEQVFRHSAGFSPVLAYPIAVAVAAIAIVFCGEIFPKVLAVTTSETFARTAAIPLLGAERVLAPLRVAVMRLTDFIFHSIGFHERHAAPFITDDELKSVISETEVAGVIEEEEREMIRGILDFSNVTLREILVPRLDVVAIPQEATVAEALATIRKHEFSRMPVYQDDLDHITGVLMMKDLLPPFAKGKVDTPVAELARPPHFVPEMMKVQQFVKEAQRRRTHLAIVVDEFGGTAGIVTLEDAIEEVVGDILDENERQEDGPEHLGEGVYRVEGGMDLEDLSELIGRTLEDEEHETVAGFLMNHTDKVLETGDQVELSGIRFTVESCDNKRVGHVRLQILSEPKEEGEEEAS